VVQCRFFAVSAARSAASPPSSSSSANRSVRPRSRCSAGLCCTGQKGRTSKLRCAASLSGRRSPRRPHPMWHPHSQRCGRSGKARRQGALRLPQQDRPGTATSRSACVQQTVTSQGPRLVRLSTWVAVVSRLVSKRGFLAVFSSGRSLTSSADIALLTKSLPAQSLRSNLCTLDPCQRRERRARALSNTQPRHSSTDTCKDCAWKFSDDHHLESHCAAWPSHVDLLQISM